MRHTRRQARLSLRHATDPGRLDKRRLPKPCVAIRHGVDPAEPSTWPRVLTAMPRGTRHEVTGLLLKDRQGGLVVEVDGGGTWRLDAGWLVRRHLGRRVRVVGVRDDYDLLAVERIVRS